MSAGIIACFLALLIFLMMIFFGDTARPTSGEGEIEGGGASNPSDSNNIE